MKHSVCGGLFVTGIVWVKKLGCSDCHSCFILRWYELSFAYMCCSVGPLTLRSNECLVLTKMYSRTVGCYKDIEPGARSVQRCSCVSSVVGHWPAVSTKHPGTLLGGWQTIVCSNQSYSKIWKLYLICFADADPEVNVQIMDYKVINEMNPENENWRVSHCFFLLREKVKLQT